MSWDDEMRNSKKTKRGKTDIARSLAGLGSGKGNSGGADYAEADFSWLAGIIIEITRRGGAASFGLSRDKGAYSVTIFLEGERKTVWISSGDDLNTELEKIVHYLASLP